MQALELHLSCSGYFGPHLKMHDLIPGLSVRFVSPKLKMLPDGTPLT